jgi:hypothetical protein
MSRDPFWTVYSRQLLGKMHRALKTMERRRGMLDRLANSKTFLDTLTAEQRQAWLTPWDGPEVSGDQTKFKPKDE